MSWRILSAILLTIFLGLTVVGFAFMNHEAHEGNGCPLGIVDAACPPNSTEMAIEHVSAYSSFSQNPLSIFFFIVSLFFVGFIYLFWPKSWSLAFRACPLGPRESPNRLSQDILQI